MRDAQAGWLASVVTLGATGTGLIVGAPYMVVGGVLGTMICSTGAILEERRLYREREMFRACNLYISLKDNRELYPKIIKQGDDYILIDLPYGMSFKDVVAKQQHMESFYGRSVLIEQTSNKKVLIKRLEPSHEEDRWLKIFKSIGIIDVVGAFPELVSSEINAIGQRVVFNLPLSMTMRDFTTKQEQLEFALKNRIKISTENYKLIIQTITKDFKKLYTIDFRQNLRESMEFLIGVERGDVPLKIDLGGNEFSTLVCGASGSGKSAFLNCLMVQMLLKDVEIYAIDLKAVEFKIFKNYKKMSKYATNKRDAVKVLENAYDLMNSRFGELEEKSCKSYADYNKKYNNAMPPVLLIIDEFSALMGDKKSNFFLFELLSRARASNILVVICTQTPRAKVIDGTIRCNIKNTICFSCSTDTDSEVALGERGNYRASRELDAEGRGFLKFKKDLVEFQGYYLTDEQIEKQIAHKMHRNSVEAPKTAPEATNGDKVISIKGKHKQANTSEIIAKIEGL